MDTGIRKAVMAAGSISKLAKALNITRAAICQWERIPAGRIIDIERVTGVRRQELRPDLYDDTPETSEAAGAAP